MGGYNVSSTLRQTSPTGSLDELQSAVLATYSPPKVVAAKAAHLVLNENRAIILSYILGPVENKSRA